MLRSDELLLAYLVSRRGEGAAAAVRKVLERRTGASATNQTVGQALIKTKLISPRDFIDLQAAIDSAKRECRCGALHFVFAGPKPKKRRCGRCGHVASIPASRNGATSTKPDRADTARPTSSRKETQTRAGASPAPGREADYAQPPLKIGPYPIEQLVARGGMGVVYKALDPKLRRVVALKVLRGDATAEVEARFRREAEAVARLRHPSIVQIHDVGIDRGMRFFTMDFIDGSSLDAVIDALPAERCAEIVAEVAEGLHHAHEKGIIHRDVKPQNILVDSSGRARITDFGLARDLGRSSLTNDGDLVGTPLFMAPEQVRGDHSKIDRRTDVYALGVLLYRGLAGSLPIEARTLVELEKNVLGQKPEPPSARRPGVPPTLDRVCLKALEKHPDDRYETALAMAKDLRGWLSGRDVDVARGSSVLVIARKLARRRGLVGGAAIGLALVVGAWLGWSWMEAKLAADARAKAEEERIAKLVADAGGTLSRGSGRQGAGRDALQRGEVATALSELEAAAQLAKDAASLAADAGSRGADEAARAAALARAVRHDLADARCRTGPEARKLARKDLEKLVDEDPKDVDARVILGRLELSSGRPDLALVSVNRALELEPARFDAHFLRAECYRKLGKASYAVLDYGRALAEGAGARASKTEVLVGRARALLDDGDADGAWHDLEDAQQEAPRDISVRLARAEVARARDKLKTAEEELEIAVKLAPLDPSVHRARGELMAALGDRGRALEELTTALDLDAEDRAARGARARLRFLAFDSEGAEEDFRRALEGGSPVEPAFRSAALARARLLRASGRLDEALAALDAASPEKPGPAVTLERAEVLIRRGKVEDMEPAVALVRAVLDGTGGDKARARRALARALLARGDPRGAADAARREVDADESDGFARALLWRALVSLKDAGADAAGRQAVRAERDAVSRGSTASLAVEAPERDAIAFLELGRRARARARVDVTRRERELERASQAFRHAIELAPELSPARAALAETQLELGQPDKAFDTLERAKDAPPAAESLALGGRILAARGDHKGARAALDEALERAKDATVDQQVGLLYERGTARLDEGDAKGALGDLEKAVGLDPLHVEALAARSKARAATGDAKGAVEDRERVDLLRGGFTTRLAAIEKATWEARNRMGHTEGARIVEEAFSIVPRTETRIRARLYYTRGFMKLRDVDAPAALLDYAAMVELDADRWRELLDELMTIPDSVELPSIVDTMDQLQRARGREPSFGFLRGMVSFLRLEMAKKPPDRPEAEAREGISALSLVLDQDPTNASALALRGLLLALAGDERGAMRDEAAALDITPGLGFAEYVLLRVSARRGDKAAAFDHLERALRARFSCWKTLDRDRDLAQLRADPRYAKTIALARANDFLDTARRLERRAGEEPDKRKLALEEAVGCCTTGATYLEALLRGADPDARLLAARLRIARGELRAKLGDANTLARDLAGALEAYPLVLGREHGGVLAAARAAADERGSAVKATSEDREPSVGVARASAAAFATLAGRRPPDTELRAAIGHLKSERLGPGAALFRALLQGAAGDADAAIESAELLRKTSPDSAASADYLRARVEAARHRDDDAIKRLSAAVDAGLRSERLAEDAAFAGISSDPRFIELARKARGLP